MKIDRAKKYEGLEMVWEFNTPLKQWCGYLGLHLTANANEDMAQKWLDAGHIQPVRETKIVRVEGVVFGIFASGFDWLKLPDVSHLPLGARSKPVTLEFEVEA